MGIYWIWSPGDGDVLDDWTLVGIKKGWAASRSDSIGSIGQVYDKRSSGVSPGCDSI